MEILSQMLSTLDLPALRIIEDGFYSRQEFSETHGWMFGCVFICYALLQV